MVARRDGLTYIAISLGSTGRYVLPWRDMRTLFAYALNDLHPVTLEADQLKKMADDAGIADTNPKEAFTLAVPKNVDADALSLSDTLDTDNAYAVNLTMDGKTEVLCTMPGSALGIAAQPTACTGIH